MESLPELNSEELSPAMHVVEDKPVSRGIYQPISESMLKIVNLPLVLCNENVFDSNDQIWVDTVRSAIGFTAENRGYGYISAIICLLLKDYIQQVSLKCHKVFEKDKRHFTERGTFDNSILAIYDELVVQADIQDSCILAGGKMTDYLLGLSSSESTGDYDLWFTDSEACNRAIYWFNGQHGADGKALYERADTRRFTTYTHGGLQFQVMHQEWSDVSEILGCFDFSPCCVAYDGKSIYWSKGALKSIKTKSLNVRFPRLSRAYNARFAKYVKKGFTASVIDFNLMAISSLCGIDNLEGNSSIDEALWSRSFDAASIADMYGTAFTNW